MLLSKQVPSLAVSFLEPSYRIVSAQGTRKILISISSVGTDARNWNLAKQRGLALFFAAGLGLALETPK